MKSLRRVPWLYCACLSSITLLSGCASSTSFVSDPHQAASSHLPAVAVIVRVAGGSTMPSSREFANIHQALRDHVNEAGYTFARNSDVADLLVIVRYTPDPLDPHTGHVAITGMQPNQMKRGRTLTVAETSAETFELAKKVEDLERRVSAQAAATIVSKERDALWDLPTC